LGVAKRQRTKESSCAGGVGLLPETSHWGTINKIVHFGREVLSAKGSVITGVEGKLVESKNGEMESVPGRATKEEIGGVHH